MMLHLIVAYELERYRDGPEKRIIMDDISCFSAVLFKNLYLVGY